jgi:hypothetical protein
MIAARKAESMNYSEPLGGEWQQARRDGRSKLEERSAIASNSVEGRFITGGLRP